MTMRTLFLTLCISAFIVSCSEDNNDSELFVHFDTKESNTVNPGQELKYSAKTSWHNVKKVDFFLNDELLQTYTIESWAELDKTDFQVQVTIGDACEVQTLKAVVTGFNGQTAEDIILLTPNCSPTFHKTYVSNRDFCSGHVHCDLSWPNTTYADRCGFCWSSENRLPEKDKNDTYEFDSARTEIYHTITGLEPNTHYKVRAFAESAHGVYYGDTISLITGKLTFEQTKASLISGDSVILSTNLVEYRYYTTEAYGFALTTDYPKAKENQFSWHYNIRAGRPYPFSYGFSKLALKTTYYYKPYVEKNSTKYYSDQVYYFTTTSSESGNSVR